LRRKSGGFFIFIHFGSSVHVPVVNAFDSGIKIKLPRYWIFSYIPGRYTFTTIYLLQRCLL